MEPVDPALLAEGQRFDACGNPMMHTHGCPNCGEGEGWLTIIEWAAAGNSGRDVDGPCSRRCALQIEWAADVAARRMTEEEG